MPDAHEAVRQYMQQEAPNKFVGVAPHSLGAMILKTIAVGKADPPVAHVAESVVRDGDAMRRAAEIVQDTCRPGKGGLGVDDPLLSVELRPPLLEALRRAQGGHPRSEGQGAGGAGLGQRRTELPAKDGTQGSHGEEEAGISLDPVLALSGQRPGRDDAVEMEMRP